jgi:hypothetical protein
MTLGDLARHLAGADDELLKWRLIAEFLEEYRWEPGGERVGGRVTEGSPLLGREQILP